jgi:hypothetical protein
LFRYFKGLKIIMCLGFRKFSLIISGRKSGLFESIRQARDRVWSRISGADPLASTGTVQYIQDSLRASDRPGTESGAGYQELILWLTQVRYSTYRTL